jgi:putative pyruvate formate lyase activating enzyme
MVMRSNRSTQSDIDPRFLIDPFEPAYLTALRSGELAKRVAAAQQELKDCCACPRNCHVDRLANETKFCATGRWARVTSAFPHLGEEDCLRGWNGSGTIFFSLCNLRCVFCQNWDISQQASGVEQTAEQLASLMLALERRGCHNINFVTPEHVAPQVIEAIGVAAEEGLRTPIVYNTSGYDSLRSLQLLDGLVDIYMPDFKLWGRDSARTLLKAKDYPERTREAILEMHRQVGPLKFGPDGVARRGVLVRHLVMPGKLDETEAVFRWLAEEVSPDTFVNIMGQYHPDHQVGQTTDDQTIRYQQIDRKPRLDEIHDAYEAASRAGLWRFA